MTADPAVAEALGLHRAHSHRAAMIEARALEAIRDPRRAVACRPVPPAAAPHSPRGGAPAVRCVFLLELHPKLAGGVPMASTGFFS